MSLALTPSPSCAIECGQPEPGHGRLLRLLETVELWSERWHQRRALRDLSDHERHDIALSAADIEAEAAKPFWRA